MSDEYWATFSIYDHRWSMYRRSLVLFDRVVIPIPKKPIGNQTKQELDALQADVDYLQTENAAVRFDWDSEEFHEWQKNIEGEVLANALVKDPLLATRLLLKEKYNNLIPELRPAGVDSVTAMPVYGTRKNYETAAKDLKEYVTERLTLEVILENMPLPADGVALPEIIELRKREDYRESLSALRQWQRDQIPKLLTENNDKELKQAGEDFKKLVTQYKKAMGDAKYEKLTTGVCSVLAVGAVLAGGAAPLIAAVAGLAPALFSVK